MTAKDAGDAPEILFSSLIRERVTELYLSASAPDWTMEKLEASSTFLSLNGLGIWDLGWQITGFNPQAGNG